MDAAIFRGPIFPWAAHPLLWGPPVISWGTLYFKVLMAGCSVFDGVRYDNKGPLSKKLLKGQPQR